jgi:phosphate-selective porin OprO/OprP
MANLHSLTPISPRKRNVRSAFAVAAVLSVVQLAAHAAAKPVAPPPSAAADEEFDQRLKVIERKLEIQAEDAQAKAREAATANASEKGFGIRGADGSYEFKLRGLLQADARFFVADPAGAGFNDTFLFRRIEPSFELNLGKLVFFRLQPQFAGDSATTADAYGELRFAPAFAIRAGKFKEPVVLENLQPSGSLEFIERGLPTELGANRDLGVQLQGEWLAGTTTYALGVFNGTPDGRDSVASDTDNRKELAARLFFEPFRNDPGFLQGLGLGVGASQGNKLNAIGATTSAATATANFNNTLPRYRSPGQNTVFTYLLNTTPTAANTVVAAGEHRRISPQAYFYRNAFGQLAEYIESRQDVAIGGVMRGFTHTAWQGLASFVLTGEDASYRGVKPAQPYVPGGEGWGALEIVARYGVLDIDDAVFPAYADPAKSVSEARDAGIGLNWYFSANARAGVNYDETQFTGGNVGGGDRDREQALLARLQVSF